MQRRRISDSKKLVRLLRQSSADYQSQNSFRLTNAPIVLKRNMYQEDHDSASLSVTLGIMRDIVTEVARRGVTVSDHLVGCLLKSVYQNPENGFSGDRPLDRDDVRRLV